MSLCSADKFGHPSLALRGLMGIEFTIEGFLFVGSGFVQRLSKDSVNSDDGR